MRQYTYADDTIPKLTTKADRNRRYRTTEKGREAAREQSTREYLSREFVAYDGEGVTDDAGHSYVLLANSRGDRIVNPVGLSWKECADFFLECSQKYPKAIHIVFSGGYDFNMMMKSFTRAECLRVYKERFPRIRGTQVAWRRGKSLHLRRKKQRVTIYDVFPFFQTSFDKACAAYLGDNYPDRELIVENKKIRSKFTLDMLPEIERYNDAELANLVRLATELRDRLNKVGMRPGRWDGPGAIASALMNKKGVRYALSRRNPIPFAAEISKAIRRAYAGGRFELIRFGSVRAPAYEYDVNSAYPAALRGVPCLAHGRWIHCSSDPGRQRFALYHVRYSGPQLEFPSPLYRRVYNGSIIYPGCVEGWYWTPEIETFRKLLAMTGPRGGKHKYGTGEIVEAYVWEPDIAACERANHSPYPFDWIDGMYAKRQALKRAGDGAHIGIKLGLNSLYGKLAQQVGWFPCRDGGCKQCKDTNGIHIPPYHELAWAGFVTSSCRAQVYEAAMQNFGAVIAFETDAIFTSEPLTLPMGGGLGDWEETRFDTLAYAQSGLYFATIDGVEYAKTRGVDRGTLTLADFERALQEPIGREQFMRAPLTRFYGMGLALAQDFEKRATWQTIQKEIMAGPPELSKRWHWGCRQCYTEMTAKEKWHARQNGEPMTGIRLGVWHNAYCHWVEDGPVWCEEYPVEWVNPNEEMNLANLRESHYEDYDGYE